MARFWTDAESPERIAEKAARELLSRKGFMLYDVGAVHALHYAEACTAYGAARVAGLLKRSDILRGLAERYAPEKLPPNTANHVDANVCGIIPLELYRQLGDAGLLALGLELADGQWRDPRPDGLSGQTRFWIDDMWMIGILQIEAFRATGRGTYLERAALELAEYVKRLQQPSGLFFHGPQAPHYWGRGNGWVAAALAEILSELPESNPQCGFLRERYGKMMETLRWYQAHDGMWRQLVDNASAWEESSCTAMFGYAVALGTFKGLLPRQDFTPVHLKAWRALCGRVDGDGRLENVCTGTGQKDDPAYYLGRPWTTGDLHGQAPLLWFAYALLAFSP